jgi:hypothetical protein
MPGSDGGHHLKEGADSDEFVTFLDAPLPAGIEA